MARTRITKMATEKTVQISTLPGVGVGVLVVRGGKVLLGRRAEAFGKGTWCLPGGHLNFGENFEEAAKREVFEEAGLEIDEIEFISISNDVAYGKHYVTIGMMPLMVRGEVVNRSTEMETWEWFSFDKLPKPIFAASESIIKNYLSERIYQRP